MSEQSTKQPVPPKWFRTWLIVFGFVSAIFIPDTKPQFGIDVSSFDAFRETLRSFFVLPALLGWFLFIDHFIKLNLPNATEKQRRKYIWYVFLPFLVLASFDIYALLHLLLFDIDWSK